MTPYVAAAGPLAWVLAETYTSMGIEGVAAVALGPVGVMLVMRRNVTQTLEGDADVRRSPRSSTLQTRSSPSGTGISRRSFA